jgi:hypothetical protein
MSFSSFIQIPETEPIGFQLGQKSLSPFGAAGCADDLRDAGSSAPMRGEGLL